MLGEGVGYFHAAVCQPSFTDLVQHHVADGREPLGLLYAGGHELEAQQEVPVILTLRTRLRQVCAVQRQVPHTKTGETKSRSDQERTEGPSKQNFVIVTAKKKERLSDKKLFKCPVSECLKKLDS